MTDLEKTLERLEERLVERLNKMLERYENAKHTNPPHNLPDEGLFNSTCDSLCTVRREMREEARAIVIADWDEDTMDWNSNPGEIICPKHGRQQAITVRPGKWDCKVCNTPPPAEPWKKCPECCGILDNAGRCHDTDCPFDVLPAAKECEHEWPPGAYPIRDGRQYTACIKCGVEAVQGDNGGWIYDIPQPPEDK